MDVLSNAFLPDSDLGLELRGDHLGDDSVQRRADDH